MFKKGCLPDPHDSRDIPLSSFLDNSKPYPTLIDYRGYTHTPSDQMKIGTCVAFGCVRGVKETLDYMHGEWSMLSPLWLYDQCKRIDGFPYMDGTTIRAAMKILAQKGCAPEALLPYDDGYYFGKYDKEIERIFWSDTRPFRIKTYARLHNIEEMNRCLAQHGPFAIGTLVTDSYEKVDSSGVIGLGYTSIMGGHCVAIVGTDVKEERFILMNSWGTNWGDRGFGYMPWDYWSVFGLDAWGVVDVHPNRA